MGDLEWLQLPVQIDRTYNAYLAQALITAYACLFMIVLAIILQCEINTPRAL
jgi:hypothetical protein